MTRAWAIVLAVVVLPGSAVADDRWLQLVGPRGDWVTVRPFSAAMRPDPVAWDLLSRVLLPSSRAARPLHPRLIASLVALQQAFDGRTLLVTSAVRTRDRWQRDSYHQVGRAVDLRIEGVSNRAVFEACRQLPKVGCGLYPRGHHVHIDVRGKAAIWVDLSRGDARPRYVRHPRAWLRRHPEAGR